MKNIDFLPEIYRQRRELLHARKWWVGIATVFALLIGFMASAQWYFRHELHVRLRQVEPQYLLAQEQKVEMARLELEVKEAERLAALYLYLEHPWPRTQILAAVAAPLPPSIQLSEVRLTEESEPTKGESSTGPDVNHRGVAEEKNSFPPATADLAAFRDRHDRQVTIVELRGDAEKTKDLHEYVDQLGKSSLIASADLKGLESGGEGIASGRSKFHLRIAIRPGHGQPDLPARGSPAEVAAMTRAGEGVSP